MQKILVVDDEQPIAESIAYNLLKEGFAVVTAADGPSAVELARDESPDLILLDIMLPGLDGFEVCRTVRRGRAVPIIMLTARESEIDRVVGLELGADDYVTKPFSMRELIARVRAVLRRSSAQAIQSAVDPNVIRVGEITIDTPRRQVTVRGRQVEFPPKEFELLRVLASNAGNVLSRERLLDAVWGYDFYGDSRTVDVHIRWVREKIEVNPGDPRYIATVRGVGYRFTNGTDRTER